MKVVTFIITWLLILAGSVEAVWGLLQVYGYEPSNHSLYALTGSFYNPGPYSGFLAMCVPVALNEWLEGKRIWKHVALVALVLMLVVLPSGMSRSAWVAALVASGYVLGMHYREKVCRYWKYFCVGSLLLAVLGVGAYHWKKDSADGRLLMWKVATLAVLEHSWQGVGWENGQERMGMPKKDILHRVWLQSRKHMWLVHRNMCSMSTCRWQWLGVYRLCAVSCCW